MKFKYNEDESQIECVAYIDSDGDLIIKDSMNVIAICQDGCHLINEYWEPHKATHKFYPGDKVEITF